MSTRQIGAALGISKSTVSEIASYARVAAVDWALAQTLAGGILLAVLVLVGFVAWGQYKAEREARAYLEQLQQQQRQSQLQQQQHKQRQQQLMQQRLQAESLAQRQREAQVRALHQEEQRKAEAWKNYYRKPAHCDDPAPHEVVECGNHHIRAKRLFEELYAQGKF